MFAASQRLQRRAWLVLAWLLLALAATSPVERVDAVRPVAVLVAGVAQAAGASAASTRVSQAPSTPATPSLRRVLGARTRAPSPAALSSSAALPLPEAARAARASSPTRDERWLYLTLSTLLC